MMVLGCKGVLVGEDAGEFIGVGDAEVVPKLREKMAEWRFACSTM